MVESINGEPGVVVVVAGRIVAAIALEIRDGCVVHIHGVGNPAKLRRPLTVTFSGHIRSTRQCAGARPWARLNARLNASSES